MFATGSSHVQTGLVRVQSSNKYFVESFPVVSDVS